MRRCSTCLPSWAPTRCVSARPDRLPAGLYLLVVLALLLVPATVRAGGFTIPLIGARMSGQAAFVAHPDDASAVYHNPAGLVLVDRELRLDVSGTGVLTNTAYRRTDYPQRQVDGKGTGEFDTSRKPNGSCPPEGQAGSYDAQGYVLAPCYREEVAPASRWGVIPFAGLAWRPDGGDVAFGLGLYSPHNATAAFPEDGAQRYFVTEGSITTVYLTPSVAWRPHPALALGAGFSRIAANARYQRAFWLGALKPLNPEELMLDLEAEGSAYGWDAGLILFPGEVWAALDGLELAASYASRAKLEFVGEIRVLGASQVVGSQFEDGFQEGQAIRREATAKFTVPDMLRLGLGWRFGQRGWVGVDLYWNNYSLYDRLTIELEEPLGSQQEFEERKDSFDSWSAAVGGRYSPWQALDLRMGVFFDQSPYPDEHFTLMSPDADKLGTSLGLSLRPGWGFELSVSYMALFYEDRVVTSSEVRPIFDTGPPLNLSQRAPFSGNGEVVDKLVHILGAQIAWGWGG